MKAFERLYNYAQIFTVSDENSQSVPSTARQFDLARVLEAELKELGIEDACVTDQCVALGHLPATPGYESAPAVGFNAHLDTAPDFCGENVHPVIHKNYDGKDLTLGCGRALTVDVFPHLPSLAGRTLMTTDGSTLLGADDKADIAEIMSMLEEVIQSGMPHGKICVAFTPDEEIGGGASMLDLDQFGAAFAYTVDGGAVNEVVYENFNAAAAVFTVNGFNIHPGSAKGTMKNASLIAMEIAGMLPAAETPALTEGREGFFHLTDMSGNVEQAVLHYIVRDHDKAHFEIRKEMMRFIEKTINEKYGEGTAVLELREQYANMADVIAEHPEAVNYAEAAVRAAGYEPENAPIRGGTDGAQLTFRGLPCPNLGTGGFAFHGPYEHITAEAMDEAVGILKEIVRLVGEQGR